MTLACEETSLKTLIKDPVMEPIAVWSRISNCEALSIVAHDDNTRLKRRRHKSYEDSSLVCCSHLMASHVTPMNPYVTVKLKTLLQMLKNNTLYRYRAPVFWNQPKCEKVTSKCPGPPSSQSPFDIQRNLLRGSTELRQVNSKSTGFDWKRIAADEAVLWPWEQKPIIG